MAQKKRCDLCSGDENYPGICICCHSPEKHYHKSSKKNNVYVEIKFMLLKGNCEKIKEEILSEVARDYLKVVLDHTNVSEIHYKDKLSNLCLKVFHIEYEHQLNSLKKELPKNIMWNEYTIDVINQTAHTKAKDYLEVTIINMINNVKKNINKKRRT